MALTFNDLVDRARAIAPEISQALAVSFANERTGRLVAESEYRTRIGAMTATTTAGGNAVDIDTDVVDIRRAWIGTDGILSDAYEYTGRWDEAQNHEQRYEATIDKLRRLKNTKVGSGPAAIKLLTVRR
jgi:hypothetical protein